MTIKKRAFVSFDELCPYQCKHCYTYGIHRKNNRTVDEIVDSISAEEFDIIYVSQKTDNFSNPARGIDLCERLFSRYQKDLFIITRNAFAEDDLSALLKLKQRMEKSARRLFVAVSLNATESIHISEDIEKACTPDKRIEFIKTLALNGFYPILMLRPVFPDRLIPVAECLQLVDELSTYISCVVTSGLGINQDILGRLGLVEADFTFLKDQEYLNGAIDCEIRFVDVNYELQRIADKCNDLGVPVFSHSIPALNYVLMSKSDST